jgi:hypothetical protein
VFQDRRTILEDCPIMTFALASSPAYGADCLVRQVGGRAEWEQLSRRLPMPHLVQAWAYGEAKAAEGWGVERLVFEQGGRPLAICQVQVRRILGLTVAARIERGPQFMAARPTDAEGRAVYAALRRRWRFGRRGVLCLAPGLVESQSHREWLRAEGFRTRGVAGWCSAILDLTLGEATLRRQLAASWRNQLNTAERSGLGFELSMTPRAVDWILERHAEKAREKGFVGPSVSFLRALQRQAPENFFVARALRDGVPLAGMVVLRFGRSAECFIGWHEDEAAPVKADHFVLWNAALAMGRLGCERFDLGGYPPASEGRGRFKPDMRGSEYHLMEEWTAF